LLAKDYCRRDTRISVDEKIQYSLDSQEKETARHCPRDPVNSMNNVPSTWLLFVHFFKNNSLGRGFYPGNA